MALGERALLLRQNPPGTKTPSSGSEAMRFDSPNPSSVIESTCVTLDLGHHLCTRGRCLVLRPGMAVRMDPCSNAARA